jgi:hypothetical protein
MSACHGKSANCTNVWAKPLSTKATSMVFINTGNAPAKVCCDAACMKSAGFDLAAAVELTIEDLWSEEVSQITVERAAPLCTTGELPAEGGVQMVSVTM